MSVETTGTQGQDPGAVTPGQGQDPAGTQDPQPNGQQGATGQDPAASGQAFDPDTIEDPAVKAWAKMQAAELQRARQEAAQFRTERGTLQQQVQQFQRQSETAEQTAQREAQERQTRLDALEAENRDLKVGGAVQTAAVQAQAHNPAAVWELLKARGMDVPMDEQGKPNPAPVLADLKRSDPWLFKAPATGADGGSGGGRPAPAGTGQTINDMLRGRTVTAR